VLLSHPEHSLRRHAAELARLVVAVLDTSVHSKEGGIREKRRRE